MIRTVCNISEIDANQWNSLLDASSCSSAFQSSAFYDLIVGIPTLDEFVVGVLEDEQLKGVLVGFVQYESGLKQHFTKRAIINGGPLLADDCNEEQLTTLLSACKQLLRRKAIYIETRNFTDYSRYRSSFEESGFTYQPHYNFHVDTTDIDQMNKLIHQNPKRTIKSSLKAGAEIVDCNCSGEFDEWYDILKKLYSERVHTPLFPKSVFEKVIRYDFVKLLGVRYNDRIIGGGLYVLGAGTIYEWFICGEDGKYKGVYPSTLATYAGMKYAAENGFRRFDFMGAGAPGDGGYGVRDFKAKFGGELVEHGRFVCVLNKPLYLLGSLAVKIMRKL